MNFNRLLILLGVCLARENKRLTDAFKQKPQNDQHYFELYLNIYIVSNAMVLETSCPPFCPEKRRAIVAIVKVF